MTAGLRTFVRLHVVGSTGSVDVVAPDHIDAGDLIDQVTEQLQAPPAHYRLAHAGGLTLPADAPLQGWSGCDGATLHLLADTDPAADRVVHDVADTVATLTDKRGEVASVDARITASIVTAVLAIGIALAAAATDLGSAWITALAAIAVPAGVAVADRLRRRRNPAEADPATDPTVTIPSAAIPVLAGIAGASMASRLALTASLLAVCILAGAGVGLACALSPTLRPWLRPVLLGGSPLAIGSVLQLAAGFGPANPTDPSAGPVASTVVATALVAAGVAAIASVPRWALVSSGLGSLAEATTQGNPLHRSRIEASTRLARWDTTALIIGLAVIVFVEGVTLAGDGMAGTAYALLAAAAMTLCARSAGHPADVLALVAPAAALALAAIAVADVGSTSRLLLGLAVLAVASVVSQARGSRITRGRARLLLGRCETAVLLALVPVALAVTGTYSWAWAVVR